MLILTVAKINSNVNKYPCCKICKIKR